MLKIAICDDEQRFYERIQKCIDNYMQKKDVRYSINMFNSGEELLCFKDELEGYSIIFLDINMEGINGYYTAQRIRECNMDAFIVFVTAFYDYSVEGYKVNATRYVLKDELFDERMEECLDAVFCKLDERLPMLAVDFVEGTKVFSPDDIVYIESLLHYVIFHISTGDCVKKYRIKGTIAEYESRLSSRNFMRIHKSFFINVNFVDMVRNNAVEMKSGEKLPVSRAKYMIVKKEILRFMGDV